MPVSSYRRAFALRCCLALTLFATCPNNAAGQGGAPKLIRAEQVWGAAEKADKLVLMAHVSGDFEQQPFASPGHKLVVRAITHDEKLADYLTRHFVICVTQVENRQFAPPKSTRATSKQLRKREPAAVLYFCRPDHHVLHFVVGIPSARCLGNEARWAVDLQKQCADQFQAPQTVVRRQHLERLAETARDTFGKRVQGTLWERARRHRAATWVEVEHIVRSAGDTRIRLLKSRFGRALNGPVLQRMYFHPDLGTNIADMVLAELPLIRLEKIQAVAYGRIVGRSFTANDSAAADWLATVEDKLNRRRGVLMVVGPKAGAGAADQWQVELSAFRGTNLEQPRVQRAAARFEVVHIGEGHLAYVLAKLGLDPLEVTPGARVIAVAIGPSRRAVAIHTELNSAAVATQLNRVAARN